jgi:hypothetical protein
MGGTNIDPERLLQKMPPKDYLPMCKKAAGVLGHVGDPELMQMLFSKEEQEWLQKQFKERRTSP